MATGTAYFVYRTPYGALTIGAHERAITEVVPGNAHLAGSLTPTALTNRCATALQEYFAGKRTFFDLPLDPTGSDFQLIVWRALENIPFGQTRSAGEIATVIGRPSATSAVGSAARANPIAVLIPSHRLVLKDDATPISAFNRACRDWEQRLSAFE